MKEMDDIEQLFSSTFDGAEMAPPVTAKENIDKAIYASGAKGAGYWWTIGLVLLFLVGGTITFFSLDAESNREQGRGQTASNEMMTSTDGGEDNLQSAGGNDGKISIDDQVSQDEGEEYNSIAQEETSAATSNEAVSENSGTDGPSNRNSSLSNSNGTENTELVNVQKTINKSNSSGTLNDTQIGSKVESGNDLAENVTDKSMSPGTNDSELTTANNSEDQQKTLESAKALTVSTEASEKSVGELLTKQVASIPQELPIINWIDIQRQLPKPPGGNSGNLTLSLYTGMTYGVNSLVSNEPSTLRLKEKLGFYTGVEALVFNRGRYSISTGIDFSQRNYSLSNETTSTESVYVGDSLVVVFDTNQQVIDSIFYPMFENITTIAEEGSLIAHQSFGIPLYANYRMSIGRKSIINMGLGVRFSYNSYKIKDEISGFSYPEFKTFGLNVQLRPEYTYPINKLSIGIYGKLEYDLLQGMQWVNGLNQRRWATGGGLVVRYNF